MPPTKVAYVGNFSMRHCTEVHVAAALEALGCRVARLQENEAPLNTIEAVAGACDLLLYTRTWGLPDAAEAIAVWRRVEERGTITASFHLDLYLGLDRAVTLDGDPFWATGWVFTPDGDPASEAAFAERGIRHVWSPPAVHQHECVLGTRRENLAHDVVFVGSYPYPHAEWQYRNTLVEWLQARHGAQFRRYGGGATVIRNEPLNDLYASAGCVIGDSLCPGFTKPRYWSDRLPETLGRGGVLIWPRIDGVAEEGYRLDGEHGWSYTFNDWDDLAGRIDWCLTHPAEARAMAERGQEFIRTHHTYTHRMARLLHEVGLRVLCRTVTSRQLPRYASGRAKSTRSYWCMRGGLITVVKARSFGDARRQAHRLFGLSDQTRRTNAADIAVRQASRSDVARWAALLAEQQAGADNARTTAAPFEEVSLFAS